MNHERIKHTANMIRRMIREGGATQSPPRSHEPPVKAMAAPEGPKGLPGKPDNRDFSVEHHYDGENLTDPGVIDGVTGTGGGAIIQ